MAAFTTVLRADLQRPVDVVPLEGVFFTSDARANVIAVDVLDDGAPATLSGTVKGYIILPDRSTLPAVTGTLSGNRASIILPADAYVLDGQLNIVIKLETGSGDSAVRTALAACSAYVVRTTTDTAYDPGGVTPSISDLETWIAACRDATEDALEAADALQSMDAAATSVAATAPPTASVTTVDGHYRINLGIPVGVPPNFSIGTVQEGDEADVTMTGPATDPVLNFTLPKGDKGDPGTPGATGATGASPNITVGTVTKGDNAYAEITGTSPNLTLNLTLPKGDPGAAGSPGATGATPALSVGTVTTGNPGTNAGVSIRGTNEEPILDFVIPRGAKGDPGDVATVNGVAPVAGNVTLSASDIVTGTLPPAQLPIMTGATASDMGAAGAVPAPYPGDQARLLAGSGLWILPDATPISGSLNPIQSGAVATALAGKQAALTFDSIPTDGSTNPVTSDGVYDALAGKVSKAGDSMTGSLNVDDGNIQIQRANGYPTLRIMAYSAGSHDNYPSVMVQPDVRSANQAQFRFYQTVDGSAWEAFVLPYTTAASQGGSSTILTTRDFNAPEDFTGSITFSVAGYAKKATRQGRVCTIEYMSDSLAAGSWTQDKVLFTLPTGYRPTVNTFFMGAIGATPVPALFRMGTDGEVRFYAANGTLTGNPRAYLNISYSCA